MQYNWAGLCFTAVMFLLIIAAIIFDVKYQAKRRRRQQVVDIVTAYHEVLNEKVRSIK